MSRRISLIAVLFILFSSSTYASNEWLNQSAGDTVWIVIAGALVFFMQAGFALLESGMSRAKNAINVIMKNFVDASVGSLMFWAIGFGIMFGINSTGWYGNSHFAMNEGSYSDYTFLFFQIMFAATAVTIASGAMAERTRFIAYVIGAMIVCAVIYPVFGSWVWGSYFEGTGWLSEKGFIDFAGSTVVHSIGGWIALAGVIVVGPRLGRFDEEGVPRDIPGHNLTSVAMGGFILWLGWFGFNAGSTVAADASIGLIALNTHLASAAGVVGAILTMKLFRMELLMTMSVNGALAGLVSITAGCASMTPMYAVITGAIGGFVMVLSCKFLLTLRIDDVVGAIPVHGFAGAWGTIAAGIFYEEKMFDLLIISIQMIGVFAAFIWAFFSAFVMYKLIDKLIGLRIEEIGEQRGLDFSEHYEVGYPEFGAPHLHKDL